MKKAGELLASFFDNRILQTAQEYSELFSSWQSIAGDKVAAHSRIRELEHSVILVEADHPGWIQILQTREKGLLDALRRRFPEQNITGISFRLSRVRPDPATKFPEKSQPIKEAMPESVLPGSNVVDNNDTAGADPKDERFRETLKRLEESIILKNKESQK
ncbi:hypothetical protein FACS189445_5140 [Spirochaetia bacterium]|nr:hypothetical protein FACS189445_5140 [Spirochaetia bacterium]